MKIITFQDIKKMNISPSTCYEWVECMIKEKKDSVLPPKISLKPFEGTFCNIMPSMIRGSYGYYGGVKVVTRYPDNVPSLESRILFMNMESGEFLALMDGDWITAMRTGAVAAHSIMLLAKRDFSTIGIVGLGNVARASLLCLINKIPDRELNIKLLKYKGQEESFAERFKEYDNLHFSYVDTPEEMVKGSDVVLSGATYIKDDICPDDCFDKGVLLLPVHTRGFTNCDLFFDKVFADDTGHVKNFKYFDRIKQFAEISDVVNGDKPGRESDNERILVYNIGVSIHDIYFATRIYQAMAANDQLTALPDVDFIDPTDKFWV